jgi:predicted transcriptional regulator of viral defense system
MTYYTESEMRKKTDKLKAYFQSNGGTARFSGVMEAGFHPDSLKNLEKSGKVEKIARGLYGLAGYERDTYPDFTRAALQVHKGVFCLISALSYYEVTDEIPRHVDMAILRGARANKIEYPPVKFYRFAPSAWKAGVEEIKIDGINIRIYSLAKTIADCFKFRNQIGTDVARNAMKEAINQKKVNPHEILKYAKICRVDKIIMPILEAII